LLITVFHGSAASQTELYLQNLVDGAPIEPLVTDISARFLGAFGGDQLFVQTNWEAPRGRILAVDLKNPSRQNWKEIIPAGNATIRSFSAVGGRLLVSYLDNAVSELKLFSAAGKHLKDVLLPTAGSVSEMSGRWSSKGAFFSFTSFAVPPLVSFYDFDKETPLIWKPSQVPIDFDRFTLKQVWYQSRDKTRIPMFLFYASETPLHGANPILLTGYGGFNQATAPTFSAMAVVWVESGGILAVPNLRGGGEFGEDWHRAGILEKKQNVFDDFIAAAEWLIKKGYTKPNQLAIAGRSNGGLLVGAALTQRPDLFEAAVCGYPLLDMLRYHKFLVAPFWISEYGSAEEIEQFKYLRAYSPYHHVKAGVKYPAVLFVSGDSDSRVDPLHARKMTALLQSASVSGKPVLLLYDLQSGHVSGARPVSKVIKDATDELSFLFWRLGERFQ
jgi:prolyl oligopeptidase